MTLETLVIILCSLALGFALGALAIADVVDRKLRKAEAAYEDIRETRDTIRRERDHLERARSAHAAERVSRERTTAEVLGSEAARISAMPEDERKLFLANIERARKNRLDRQRYRRW